MESGFGERFAGALRRLERTGEVEEMAGMFGEGATLRRIPQLRTYRGDEGARAFWRAYVELFDEIETEFSRVLECGDSAVLEWCSRGRLRDGHAVEYEGVTIVEAGEDGRVAHFRTYYDANTAIGAQPAASRPAAEARPQ